jgi:uncharacterized membrane protein
VSIDPATAASGPNRLPWIDAARGGAILAMVVYHFSWDLRFFGFITTDVAEAPGWKLFARLIAGSFIFLVGIGLVLSTRRGLDRRRFLRRLAAIAASAAAITAVTWVAMPDAFIFFGILHAIAVFSVLGLAFVWAPAWLTAAAAVLCFAAPALLAGPFFDAPALAWLGLAEVPPRSNDFVPVFPWLGVTLAGITAAHLALAWDASGRPLLHHLGRPAPQALVTAGRYSLPIYLVHQPVLFGLVYVAAQIVPPDLIAFEDAFLQSCTTSCVESEVETDICRGTCSCLADRSQEEGLWASLMRDELSEAQSDRYWTIVSECRAAAEGRR